VTASCRRSFKRLAVAVRRRGRRRYFGWLFDDSLERFVTRLASRDGFIIELFGFL
jgi:hypothetical protein